MRPRWTDLSGTWGFAYDDEDVGLIAGWHLRTDVFDRSIRVPFPPESQASGIGDTSFHPVLWYRRTFNSPWGSRSRRRILNFGAVDYRARVWVNGHLVAEHEGGHTPFKADITQALSSSVEQTVVVRAEDRADDLEQPRGKQDWQEKPHAIWYERTSGIWQPVWLEQVGQQSIESLEWTSDLDAGQLILRLTVNDVGPDVSEARVRLHLLGETVAEKVIPIVARHVVQEFDLAPLLATDPEAVLWSPDHPNLIDAQITLASGGTIVDEVHSYAGMRSVGTAEGRFLLNKQPYFLRLALEQGYWPESHLAAPSAQALRDDVELAKKLGFNGLRIHQKVEDPRFLYWCDRLGLLTFGEMPNAQVFSERSSELLLGEWIEAVQRDLSHPCIVAWCPLNESWGVPEVSRSERQQAFVKCLGETTKGIDPTRPVLVNDGWEYLCGDLMGIHDYEFSGSKLRERYGSRGAGEMTTSDLEPGGHRLALVPVDPATPVILSEFGGIGFDADKKVAGWSGYGTVANDDDFLAKYAELLWAVNASSVLAGFCYTQLTDTAQEKNGLVDENRIPKVDPTLVAAITRGEAVEPTLAATDSPLVSSRIP